MKASAAVGKSKAPPGVEEDPREKLPLACLSAGLSSDIRYRGSMTNVYTLDEVARHNTEKDLWIVIDGSVYDVTTFFKEHPGGEEAILQSAGEDATENFNGIGHSQDAINLRKKYKIGELAGGERSDRSIRSTEKKRTAMDEPPKESKPTTSASSSEQPWILLFICVLVVIYAILFYRYS